MSIDDKELPTSDALSRAYKDLATERVSESLNQRILEQATMAATETPRAGLLRWQRPLAIAATIGLSLAIVLEVHDADQLVTPQQPVTIDLEDKANDTKATVESAEREVRSVRDNFLPRTPTVMDDADEQMRQRIGPNRDDAQYSEPEAAVAKRALRQPEVLREEVDIADGALSGLAVQPSAENLSNTASEAPCAGEDGSAEVWLSCIRRLKADGQLIAADRALERFQREYPDYDVN